MPEDRANKMDLVQGRSAMWRIEAELLARMCSIPGDHIEIGVLWGASSIIAAKAKPHPGHVYSIDIMQGGYWVDGDPSCNKEVPTARAILSNFYAHGVQDRITLICGPSDPLPVGVKPSTALIDGGHRLHDLKKDWENISAITSEFIAIHDYGNQHPDVKKYVDETILEDSNWEQVDLANSLLVLKRVEVKAE